MQEIRTLFKTHSLDRSMRDKCSDAGELLRAEFCQIKETLTSPTAYVLFGAVTAGKVAVLAMANDAIARRSWKEGAAAFVIENVLLNYCAIPFLTRTIDKGVETLADRVPAVSSARHHISEIMHGLGEHLTKPAIKGPATTVAKVIGPAVLTGPVILDKIAHAPVRALMNGIAADQRSLRPAA